MEASGVYTEPVYYALAGLAGALAELRRVLRGGGRLALTYWGHPPSPALGLATEAIARGWGPTGW